MKRIAALVLVLALMFSFTACQNEDKNVNANQTAEPVATKTPEEIGVRIGGFKGLAEVGLKGIVGVMCR